MNTVLRLLILLSGICHIGVHVDERVQSAVISASNSLSSALK
jgi:hypothetical protein